MLTVVILLVVYCWERRTNSSCAGEVVCVWELLLVLSFTVGVYMVRHLVQFFPPASLLGLLLVGGTEWFQRIQLVSLLSHSVTLSCLGPEYLSMKLNQTLWHKGDNQTCQQMYFELYGELMPLFSGFRLQSHGKVLLFDVNYLCHAHWSAKPHLLPLQVGVQPLWRMEGRDDPHPRIHHRGIQLHHILIGNGCTPRC